MGLWSGGTVVGSEGSEWCQVGWEFSCSAHGPLHALSQLGPLKGEVLTPLFTPSCGGAEESHPLTKDSGLSPACGY